MRQIGNSDPLFREFEPVRQKMTWVYRPAKPAKPKIPESLKQRVQAVCGQRAQEVEVVAGPDYGLVVKVKLAKADAEKELTEKILQLPEMAAPRVRLEVELMP